MDKRVRIPNVVTGLHGAGGGSNGGMIVVIIVDGYMFEFIPVKQSKGLYKLQILTMPNRKDIDWDIHWDSISTSTLYSSENGYERRYVWISDKCLTSFEKSVRWAHLFAIKLVRYIKTGKIFRLPRDNED